jgi:hypothetical protein
MPSKPIVLSFLMLLASFARAVDKPLGPVVAFAYENQLLMGIGKYEPGKGWSSLAGLTRPSEPGDVFTIYTMTGEVAHVKNTDPYRSPSWQTPVEWSAQITAWYHGEGEPYGVAVFGDSPVKAEAGRSLSLDQADIVAEVSAYLKTQHLHVPEPILTQAYEVNLPPAGSRSILITAHSDMNSLKDNEPAAIYALALILQYTSDGWKATALEKETSFKPQSQTLADHRSYYGVRDSYRLLACPDLDGDGNPEIALYLRRDGINQIDVFTWNGVRPVKVLSSSKHTYN